MVEGLSIQNIVNVQVILSPLATPRANFGIKLTIGDSNVISGVERIRIYTTLTAVATDFGTSAPEYLDAALYFGQVPAPTTLMIGRWLSTDTAGYIVGGVLTSAQQVISNWTSITDGSFLVTVDGNPQTLTDLDFSGAVNLNGVASVITTALDDGLNGVCTWSGSQFIITSPITGTSSTVSYATIGGGGTDVSSQLALTAALASVPVPGFDSETPLAAVQALVNYSGQWYGCNFASTATVMTSDYLAIAGYIQGISNTSRARILGLTTNDPNAYNPASMSDVGYQLMQLGYTRAFGQYSSTNPYAISSFMGRAFTVNFNANLSTITMMFKTEPGVIAETLTETQAQALGAKRYNVFVNYQNNTAILQNGTMFGPAWFDEIQGLDWLKDAIENAVYNLFYTNPTKIPQTDGGMNQFKTVVTSVLNEGVNNGLIAPGVWTGPSFGQLQTGDTLQEGYYIFIPPIATQSQADREARMGVPMQIGVKLAGAIQSINITVTVNR